MNGQSLGRLVAVPYSEIKRGRVEWLDPQRVPIGGITIVFGDPGLGKSQWTCLLAARLSRGEFGEPAVSLMLTAEDDTTRTIRPRLEAAGADLERVRDVRAESGERGEGFELPGSVQELERLIRESNARLVVIDPVSAHLDGNTNSWRESDVRRALRPLAEIAERCSCAIVLVMHLNKSSGSQAIYRAGGSIGFVAAARSSLLFARDPDDSAGETGPQRALSHVKSNLGPEAATLLYAVEPIVLPTRGDEPETRTSRLRVVGESSRTGRDLLSLADDEVRGAVDEAVDFLTHELAGEPRAKADIVKAARAEGISEKALRTARERLGATVQRAGYPSRSYWSLSRARPLWAPLDQSGNGHDWGNPHGNGDSGASEALGSHSRALSQIEGTTGVDEAEIERLERLYLRENGR